VLNANDKRKADRPSDDDHIEEIGYKLACTIDVMVGESVYDVVHSHHDLLVTMYGCCLRTAQRKSRLLCNCLTGFDVGRDNRTRSGPRVMTLFS
jgi:hypothetical protein